MSSNLLLKPPSPPSLPNPNHLAPFLSIPLPLQKPPHLLLLTCSLSPPTSRSEAISQAKSRLSTTLRKPLTSPTRKLKKQRQPRYRVEIPLLDDSPHSLTQLALDVLSDLPLKQSSLLILWPDPALLEPARRAFGPGVANNQELGSCTPDDLASSDLVVFMAPHASQLDEMKMVCGRVDPRPVVLFNPDWGFEEELGMGSFAASFDVVYSFMGLEVRGILSRRQGVIFKGEEGWVVMVEDEGSNGEMKVVSRFRRRPSMVEVESLLYNLMAANSPLTKSVKFVRDLASSFGGKKNKDVINMFDGQVIYLLKQWMMHGL